MKKLVIAALATSAIVTTPAFAADTDTQSFDITASIANECSLEDPQDVALGALSINEAPGSSALLINSNTTSPSQSVWASCNYVAKMTLTSTNTGLLNPSGIGSADPAEFTDKIHYRVTFDTDVQDVTLQTVSGTTNSTNQTSAFHDQADITVAVYTADNLLRPVSGSYSDTVTVTLGPV